MNWNELQQEMRKAVRENRKLMRYIRFSNDTFDRPYSEEERTYVFSCNNRFFEKDKISNALVANCLDGKDKGVRLDWYFNQWKIEDCGLYENGGER